MNIQEIINVLKMAPGSSADSMTKQFVEELSKEHRTNQASVIRNMQTIMSEYGMTIHDNTDLRNEAAVEVALEVACIDKRIPYV